MKNRTGMKRRNRRLRILAKNFRSVRLYARFTPGDLDADGRVTFATFLSEAMQYAAGLQPQITEGNDGTLEGSIFTLARLSLIHISEPTRLLSISYAVFCL